MVFISEPWKSGRSALIPILLDIEEGPETSDEQSDFIIYSWGPRKRTLDGIAVITNDTYSDLARFGRPALRNIKAVEMPHPLLERISIVEGPDVGVENPKLDRGYSLEEVHSWFAARADAIVVSFEPDRIDIGSVVESVLKELDHQQDQAFFLLSVNGDGDLASQLKSHRQMVWNIAPHVVSREPPKVMCGGDPTTAPYVIATGVHNQLRQCRS